MKLRITYVVFCVHSILRSRNLRARAHAYTFVCIDIRTRAHTRREMPHINLLTKCDLIKDKKKIDDFLDPDSNVLLDDLNKVPVYSSATYVYLRTS